MHVVPCTGGEAALLVVTGALLGGVLLETTGELTGGGVDVEGGVDDGVVTIEVGGVAVGVTRGNVFRTAAG